MNEVSNRLASVGIMVLVLFSALLVRVSLLGTVESKGLTRQGEQTLRKVKPIPATRGRILARDGRVLVDNLAVNVVKLDWTKVRTSERTAVLTRLLPPTARAMRRIEKITGRSDDMIKIRGVMVFPTQVEELILKQPELAPHYVIELSKSGPLDHMTVLVELAPGARDQNSEARLAHNIKSLIGVTADVKIVPLSTIERSIGKAKRVIDKRAK